MSSISNDSIFWLNEVYYHQTFHCIIKYVMGILKGENMKKILSKDKTLHIITGAVIAVGAALLTHFGNPKNMGFCIACFIRDTAGGMRFQNAPAVQYVRPEIIGLILGSFIMAIIRKDFKPRSGSSPVLRFVIGAMVMMCALVFLGCPLRMIIRLAGGDLNALVALIGFVCGIFVGVVFLNKGISLGRADKRNLLEGVVAPASQVILLILLLATPAIFVFSEKGPGSMRAPIYVSLIIALIIGALAELSRICTAGSIRDLFLTRDYTLFLGPLTIFIVLLIINLVTGNFKFGFSNQPIAHSDHLWNLLSFFAVGLGSVMLGGCPLRQLILAGEGNGDSFITMMGMFFGAALSHNFNLAGVAGKGATTGGKVIVIISILFLVGTAWYIANRNSKEA